MNNMNHHYLKNAVGFLNAAGLPTHWSPGASGFIEGIRIVRGELFVDPACRVSGLLHEAAHVGCVPAQYRHLINDDVSAGIREMFDSLNQLRLHPDHPLSRAAKSCSDPEATALAWGYGIHLGIPHESIIMDDEYGGTGAKIRDLLAHKAYLGINGLQHAGGFTRASERYTWMREPAFPALGQWLQAEIAPDPVPGLLY